MCHRRWRVFEVGEQKAGKCFRVPSQFCVVPPQHKTEGPTKLRGHTGKHWNCENNINVKPNRLTRRLATANNMSIRSEITNFCPPPTSGPLRASASMMDAIENYLSLDLWSPCKIWLLLYIIPCWCILGSQNFGTHLKVAGPCLNVKHASSL